MEKFFVFNDRDGREQFLSDIPVDLDDGMVELVGDRELHVSDRVFDALLTVPTDQDYVVEERE